MSGCLENLGLPQFEWMQAGDRRNRVASIVAGILFFSGWWIDIDVAACYPQKEELKDVFHICGVFGTLSMLMVNAVSNGQLRGDSFTDGCLGVRGARVWFFVGFLLGFGSLLGACWILFGEYVIDSGAETFQPTTVYPGVAIFLQNLLIFFSSLVYKFGRTEDSWN